MNIEVSVFGHANGVAVNEYVLTNDNGMRVTLLNYGGIIKEIIVPDKSGIAKNCVQTFDTLEEYIEDASYRGAIVGRYANRIGHGKFILNDEQYNLELNGGKHNLHGGLNGFHKKVWEATTNQQSDEVSLSLSLFSPDGEGGFPGNVNIKARYTLTNENELIFHVCADTDKATPLSFTQHAYFVLSNEDTVGSTKLKINADSITDVDDTLLPTGDFVSVAGTPFDFRDEVKISTRAHMADASELYTMVGGYDHNYVLNEVGKDVPQAVVKAPDSGVTMALYTTLPGLQFYTGNLQSDVQIGALCLEPQHFPDAPNKVHFPNCITHPNNPFEMTIRYRFGVQYD